LLAGLALPGCKGCDRDHPYVPYVIGSTPTAPTTTGAPVALPTTSARPAGSVDGGVFARVPAQQAPSGTTNWVVGGLPIVAPPGRFVLSGLALQQPGQPQAVAAFVGDGGSISGEVVIYRSDGAGRVVGPTTLARLPDWLPSGQDCTHMPTLSQIGPTTLWLDLASVCPRVEPRKPNRYLAAVSTSLAPAVRVELRLSDPGPGERLGVEADAADRDGDGTDDLLLQLSLEGAPPPLPTTGRASASLRFFGRPAGLSRDPQEPGQSLRSLATWQGSQATRKEAADAALAGSRQLRRLHALICPEGGSPVLTLGGEASFLDDSRYAEARALLTQGNAPAAFAIATRLRDGKSKIRRLADLDAAIEAQSVPRKASARPLKTYPRASSVALPIAFDAAGSLLMLTEDSVIKIDPATGDESPSDAPRWNPLAELAGDSRVTDTIDPCKSDFLRVRVRSGGASRDLLTALPGASGPTCAAEANIRTALLDRNADGLIALIQGEPLFVASDGEKAQVVGWPQGAGGGGSTRSPDGRWTAIAGGDRVYLRGPEKGEVWKPQPSFSLQACTVANQGKAVACLLEKGVVVLTP
jgi:hypothetical protein